MIEQTVNSNETPTTETTTEKEDLTVEREKENSGKGTEVSIGKFNSVDALLSAYNSLQSEFTKRCQRIKELETEIKGSTKNVEENNTTSITDKDKEDILKEYLKAVLKSKSAVNILDEAGASTVVPVSKPKTVEEAGSMALELLKKGK